MRGGVQYSGSAVSADEEMNLGAMARSAWLTLRRQGVRWRDHLYPLDELRAHVRLRNAWTREVWRSTR